MTTPSGDMTTPSSDTTTPSGDGAVQHGPLAPKVPRVGFVPDTTEVPGSDQAPASETTVQTASAADPSGSPPRLGAPISPRPPQTWFTPPQPEPAEPTAGLAAAARDDRDRHEAGAGGLLCVGLIGIAALLLLSPFLPWTSVPEADVERGGETFFTIGRTFTVYGLSSDDGGVVVLAGMAALALALAARAVSRRFAPYVAYPGALSLLAICHRGVTRTGVPPQTFTWGYWLAVFAAVAMIAIGLVSLGATDTRPARRTPDRQS